MYSFVPLAFVPISRHVPLGLPGERVHVAPALIDSYKAPVFFKRKSFVPLASPASAVVSADEGLGKAVHDSPPFVDR